MNRQEGHLVGGLDMVRHANARFKFHARPDMQCKQGPALFLNLTDPTAMIPDIQ